MKKTKCDGESPCKRCKDDGLVCTAGSRKKTEFKQLPRGYAEVLENTQYALIATVQKLYTMVRNNEPWLLGEPELNDRGLPVIHNIAEKLGCIRPSPDLPCAFPEDEAEFAELQRSLFANKVGGAAHADASEDESERKDSTDSGRARPARNDRASSSESDHSSLSRDYTQMMWPQQGGAGLPFAPQELFFKMEPGRPSISTAFDNSLQRNSMDSPVYSDFASVGATDSPIFRPESPFAGDAFGAGWAGSNATDDEFLAPSHMLDLTALYMRQQQQRQFTGVPTMATGRARVGFVPNGTFVPNGDGTIRPAMLDGRMGGDLDGMDGSWGLEYDAMATS